MFGVAAPKATAALLLLAVAGLCLLHTAAALNCYTSVDMSQKEDCDMHTGCMKKFNAKTRSTVTRSCFLSDGKNDTCGVDKEGWGVCYCHSDLCNAATTTAAAGAAAAAAVAAGMAAAVAKWRVDP